MAKKQRIDTAKGEADMWAGDVPSPPAHMVLPKEAREFWLAITRARDYSAWTEIDLQHAVSLACTMADQERIRAELRVEGDIVVNARGTQIANPKHGLLETLNRRAIAMCRMLHIHPEATEGESRDSAKRSKAQREVQAKKEQIAEDDLIAKPQVH